MCILPGVVDYAAHCYQLLLYYNFLALALVIVFVRRPAVRAIALSVACQLAGCVYNVVRKITKNLLAEYGLYVCMYV